MWEILFSASLIFTSWSTLWTLPEPSRESVRLPEKIFLELAGEREHEKMLRLISDYEALRLIRTSA